MPITRRQFELGINEQVEEVMKAVGEFLGAHPQEAFDQEELAFALGVVDENDGRLERTEKLARQQRFSSALSRL